MKMKQCLVATLLTAVLLSSPAAFATGPEEDMAKLMFSEAYDVTDTIELSRIAWSILNRVDAGEASSIAESVRQYNFKVLPWWENSSVSRTTFFVIGNMRKPEKEESKEPCLNVT